MCRYQLSLVHTDLEYRYLGQLREDLDVDENCSSEIRTLCFPIVVFTYIVSTNFMRLLVFLAQKTDSLVDRDS